MLWNDPWIEAATTRGLRPGPFCTLIPPPRPVLHADYSFDCVAGEALNVGEWQEIVRSGWSDEIIRARLTAALVPCLRREGQLIATCVLRPQGGPLWVMETFVARWRGSGYGGLLLRCFIDWMWRRFGPVTIGYTWELTTCQLLVAGLRGWLASAVSIQMGWTWTALEPTRSVTRPTLPVWMSDKAGSAVVTDSGLGDGWGYVSAYRGSPSWDLIAKKGGWQRLWFRGDSAPSDQWKWSGEFVVVAFMNSNVSRSSEWITAEITAEISCGRGDYIHGG